MNGIERAAAKLLITRGIGWGLFLSGLKILANPGPGLSGGAAAAWMALCLILLLVGVILIRWPKPNRANKEDKSI